MSEVFLGSRATLAIQELAIKRLPFQHSPFFRKAWVSDKARSVWEPVINDIANAIPAIFAFGIRAGLFQCALIRIATKDISKYGQSLSRIHGLTMAVLKQETLYSECVICKSEHLPGLSWAWQTESHDRLANLLKVPECCRKFQRKVHNDWGFVDTTLPRALNTPGAMMTSRTVEIMQGGLLNPILSVLGIRPVCHEPCSLSCSPSLQMAALYLSCGGSNGFEKEMAALREVSQWPAEWSALHGIAEIKTPILKVTTNTDATAENYRIRFASKCYPPEGAVGLQFPYQQPHRLKTVPQLSVLSNARPNSTPMKLLEDKAAGIRLTRSSQAPLRQHSRSSATLDEIFDRIRQLRSGHLPPIQSIFLSNYFNVLQLEDLSIGAAMNYCRFKSEDAIARSAAELEAKLPSDPLLLKYLFTPGEPDLLQLSLKTCLVSALSRELLLKPADLTVEREFYPGLLPDASSAIIIGFGGYLDYIIRHTNTAKVHISDFDYRRRARRMDGAMNYYRQLFPQKEISISDGSDIKAKLAAADLVSITGSAFCSGTMDELLDASRHCKTVIVQGQSAAVIPQVLFEKGVTLMSTTIKPDYLIEVGRTNPAEFRSLLEGKLRPVFLRPKSRLCCEILQQDRKVDM